MRYRDIKIVEETPTDRADYSRGRFSTEPADEKLVRTYCDAIKKGKETSQNFNNPKWLNRAIATAEKFAKDNPQYASQIAQCISTAGSIAGTSQGNNKGVDQGNTSGQAPGANIATGDDTTANGGGITGIPSNQNNTGVTGDGQGSNKLKAAADELSRLLDKEDWQGANDLIKGDPNLQALLPDELISDLDAAIQAEADAKAADTAEEQRLADEVEEKRNDAIKADAARIAAKVADDKAAEVKAEKKAEASRIEAERLEQELEQQQTNPGSTPPTSIPDPNQPFDASDWGDDQSLKRFPVSELNAARSKYYVNLTREEELFFNTDGSIRSMTPIEQRELDALERERKELLKKYGDGILMVDKISTRFVGGDN